MAQCTRCDCSGWLLCLIHNALCQRWEPLIVAGFVSLGGGG
jgi:hypothetical protein